MVTESLMRDQLVEPGMEGLHFRNVNSLLKSRYILKPQTTKILEESSRGGWVVKEAAK